MAAQVEAVALQALVRGAPRVQVEAAALQVLAAGARTVEVEAFAVQALVPDVSGGTEITGVAAAVTLSAPAGTAGASSIVLDVTVSGEPASVTMDAPNGVLSIISGDSVALSGTPAAVTLDAPAGDVVASVSVQLAGSATRVALNAPLGTVGISKNLTGPAAPVRLAAPAGQVFAGTIPQIVETVRVAGVTGTTFTLPFTKPVEAGDVVVVSYIGDISPLGDRVSTLTASGMGGTWDRTPSDPMNLRTQDMWAVSTDVTATGSVTVTVDRNLDPMLTGFLIRGANGNVAVDRSAYDQVYRNAGIGEVILVVGSADPGSTLDLVNSSARPDESVWTELPHYVAKSGSDRQVVYATPDHADAYALFPFHTTPSYKLAALVVGQAAVDVNLQADDAAAVNLAAPPGMVDAHIQFDPLNGAGTLTLAPGRLVDFVVMTETSITAGGDVSLTGDVLHAAVMADVTLNGGGSVIARPRMDVKADPRTGRDQWRYVVTDLQGVALGELTDIQHDPIEDGVNEPASMSFPMATDDPARSLIKPIERQCQVWQGDQLRLRGPILPGNTADDGASITYTVHDPSWWWRDGRKRIGRVPKRNLLRNGDFTRGTTYWTPGFDRDSIPAAAPKVQVVADNFTDGGKALQINGVESVTQTKAELQSSAVFWPNRPFASEPLAAGFRPGGTDAVDNVAKAMPTTTGLKVTIVGHTANDGTGNGLELSKRRAEAAAARIKALRPNAVLTTKGVGFYDPDPKYPVNSQQQRRVVISYASTTTISGKSKQWVRQRVEVTQPKDARYSLDLVAAARLKVTDDWSIEDANMVSVKILARRKDGRSQSKSAADALASATDDYSKAVADLKSARADKTTTASELKSAQDAVVSAKAKLGDAQVAAYEAPWDDQLGVGESSISDTDPVDRWLRPTAQVTIPADGRTYIVDVYLYAPAAQARYTRVSLEPQELLYFWGTDQALIVKGLVEHMQDPITMMGHEWPITVGTRTPLTGVERDRAEQYRFSDRMPIDTALEEFPALYRGVDIDVLTTPTRTTVATFYPQQGQTVDYPLVLGGNIEKAVPASTRDVGSLVIAQAQDSSAARDEAYAADPRAFGGLMLQRLITAEQETPVNELDETARAELKWAKVSTPAYWLDVDPESIAEVLAETGKGDTVRLILDGPDKVDALARIVKRQIHPDSLRLMVALEGD